jgi:hypothetical protein
LETRPPNVEGKGAVKQRDLVINALRMRPDRIILGAVLRVSAGNGNQHQQKRQHGTFHHECPSRSINSSQVYNAHPVTHD